MRHTLEGSGQAWAASAYKKTYSWTCWESALTGAVMVGGKPSGVNITPQEGYPGLCMGGEKHSVARWLAMSDRRFGMKLAGKKRGVLTVSHLCHSMTCVNPSHLVYELDRVNYGRSACVGGTWCRHPTTCIRPGSCSRGAFCEAFGPTCKK